MFKKLAAIVLVIFFLTLSSQAAIFKSGDEIYFSPKTRTYSNLVVTGKKIILQGYIKGDVFAAGEEIVIDGRVDGDIYAVGKEITVRAYGVEDLWMAGQKIFIKTRTAKDIYAIGQNIELDSLSQIKGDVVFYGKQLQVGGYIRGKLKAQGEAIELHKNLRVIRGKNIIDQKPQEFFSKKWIARGIGAVIGFKIYHVLLLWLLLWVIQWAAPNFFSNLEKTMENKLIASIGISFILLVLLPFAFILLAISIIGIPLIFLIVSMLVFIGFTYKLPLALWLGRKIYHQVDQQIKKLDSSRRRKPSYKKPSIHAYFWTGIVTLFLISLIPIASSFLMFLGFVWILGSLLIQRREIYLSLRSKGLL